MSADAPSPAPSNAPRSLGSFSARPYRADGGMPIGGSLQLVGALGIVGMILGAVASVISRFFYLVLLFPIGIGCCLGGVGAWAITAFRIRNPLACGMAGFLASCLAMFSMHYVDYRDFDGKLKVALGPDAEEVRFVARNIPQFKRNWDEQPEELKQYITDLEQDPDGLRALQVDNVWKFIDMMAHQGVELKRAGGAAKGGANLGYTGSYIYWGVEALIVAGIAFAMMRSAAAAPFCRECNLWKEAEERGPFSQPLTVARILEQGALEQLPYGDSADTVVTLFACPECGAEGTIDVRVEQVSVNGKGETSKVRLGQWTYPGEAHGALKRACSNPGITEPEVDAE